MNGFDVFLLIILLLSVISGFRSGFARVGVGFIAAIAAVICGFWFYGLAGGSLLPYLSSKYIANLVGFFLVFIIVLLIGAVLGRLLAALFKWVGLSWLDRFLGGAFGLVRGGIIIVALIAAIVAFSPSPPSRALINSKIMPYAIDLSNAFASMAPHELKDGFHQSMQRLKRIWADQFHKPRRLPGEEV